MTQRRCREAIALAERYGWGAEPVIAPALMTLASTMVWLGEFDEGERWLRRTERALQTDTGPDIGLLLHLTAGMLHAGRGRHHEALEEFSAAEHLGSQLEGSHALASQVTGWMLATQARLGRPGEARAVLAAVDDERAGSGEIRNARAVICLAEGDPAGALGALRDVLDGTAPVLGYVTVVEADLLAGLAHRELGDQRAANQAAERALALAESDRLVLPFAMTGSRELLEALPRHETAHAALLADILDVLHGSSPAATRASPHRRRRRSSARASSGCCDISRRTCPGPRSQANCPSRRTRSARTSAASTPSSRSVTAPRPCSARRELRLLAAGRTR